MNFNTIVSFLSFSAMGFNWVDFLILIVVIFYCFEGYALGFFSALLDLISFIASFALGLIFYGIIAKLLVGVFSMPSGFANAIGFFTISFFAEIILSFILKHLILTLPYFAGFNSQPPLTKRINSFMGIVPAFFSALLLLAFILTMVITLPVSVFLKHSVTSSRVGKILVINTQGFAKDINNVFGGAVNETLAFLTVEPKSTEIVNLNFKIKTFSIDWAAEEKMLSLVNQERLSRGLLPLNTWNMLTDVARSHCQDMLKRGYFSHYTPDGLSPFDRMAQADIEYSFAGENLALAPNVDLAMKGLMQSPGHRENILSPNFQRIGIGVIDAGVYGEMFCQEFTN